MGNQYDVRIARAGTFADQAGEYLYANGPTLDRDLFEVLAMVSRVRDKQESLQAAIRNGWLAVGRGGLIDCSAAARAHYDALAGKVAIKPLGQIAAPREAANAFQRPALSKKYIPNSRGSRLDIPSWSVRPAGFGFKSIGGGKA